MDAAWLPALLSVALVSLVSLAGAATGIRFLTRHLVVLTLVALAAGSLLGDALLHLMPEAADLWGGFTVELSSLVILGFFAFFVMESALRWRHAHGEILEDTSHGHNGHGHGEMHGLHAAPAMHAENAQGNAQLHSHTTAPSTKTAHTHGVARPIAPFAWMNLIGDGVHNFLDGVVIAAAYLVDMQLGIATTVAVALHEIPQELGDFAVLVRAGVAPRRALLYNLLSAFTAVVGAVLFLVLPFDAESLERIALPITAGGFLYIAAADLIPELHHHTGDRHVGLIVAGLVAGIGLMFALLQLG